MQLENLNQPPYNTTFVGVIDGIAKYYGYRYDVSVLEGKAPKIEITNDAFKYAFCDPDRALLYGLSGHAFLINVHEGICPSGPYLHGREVPANERDNRCVFEDVRRDWVDIA